jgi:hypothetical protein
MAKITVVTEKKRNLAQEALDYYWAKNQLVTRWMKSIIVPHRGANAHISDFIWAQILQLRLPQDQCIFTKLKNFKGGANYKALCVPYPEHTQERANLGCHRIAALIFYDAKDEVRDPRGGDVPVHDTNDKLVEKWHASHWYCHNEACVNPLHLLPESNTVNQERNTCKRHKTTRGFNCPHFPTCNGLSPCTKNRIRTLKEAKHAIQGFDFEEQQQQQQQQDDEAAESGADEQQSQNSNNEAEPEDH